MSDAHQHRPEAHSASQLPLAVARGREIADLVRGRDLLFKARNYMGPVYVDEVACSYRWFTLKMTTRPWRENERSRQLDWKVQPSSVTMTPVRISVRVHDMVGMLVHDALFIEQIEQLRKGGATVQDLLLTINRGRRFAAEF